jgi:hypothetical protein
MQTGRAHEYLEPDGVSGAANKEEDSETKSVHCGIAMWYPGNPERPSSGGDGACTVAEDSERLDGTAGEIVRRAILAARSQT